MKRRSPRLTARKLEAILSAVTAMLAGGGEGDAEGVNMDDLSAGETWLSYQLSRREKK